jgi:amidohydrolase
MNQEALIKLRRRLHQYPEVSGEEERTAQSIAELLNAFSPNRVIEQLGGHGVLAVFDSGKPGKKILIRAELDGLPIQEENTFPYRSKRKGKGHKCGHDGHMAILIGLAAQLERQPLQAGQIYLLFQPAEENGTGAAKVLKDPAFQEFQPDLVFALHNLPGYPMNKVICRDESFTAAVKSKIIRLSGWTSHAAEPENSPNLSMAIAHLIQGFHDLHHPDIQSRDFSLITPVHLKLGEQAYGITPGYGEVHITYRAYRQAVMDELENQLNHLIREDLSQYGEIRIETEELDVFEANRNTPSAMEIVRQAASELDYPVHELGMPLKWGEDFGYFTQTFSGAMFGLGAGEETPVLHHPMYDFPDELLETGKRLFRRIIKIAMAQPSN